MDATNLLVIFSLTFCGLFLLKRFSEVKFDHWSGWGMFICLTAVFACVVLLLFYENLDGKQRLSMISMIFIIVFGVIFSFGFMSSESIKNYKDFFKVMSHELLIMTEAFSITLIFWYMVLFILGAVIPASIGLNLEYFPLLAIPISVAANLFFGIYSAKRFILMLNHWAMKTLISLIGGAVVYFNLLSRWSLSVESPNILAVAAFYFILGIFVICAVLMIVKGAELASLEIRMRKVILSADPQEYKYCAERAVKIYRETYLPKDVRKKLEDFLALAAGYIDEAAAINV